VTNTRRLIPIVAASLLAAGCSDVSDAPTAPPPPGEVHEGSFTLLALATPDGSGQTVHPDYVGVPGPWAGVDQYLVATPYRNGDASLENPSLYAGPGGHGWSAPAGLVNPIVRPAGGYLSDPDVVFVPELGQLWVYYRRVASGNEILLVTSADGVHFSAPRAVVSAPSHDIVSPSVVRRGPSDWLMWSVNSNVGCTASGTTVELRRSANGVDFGPPVTVDLAQPGWSVWHVEVQWIESLHEYWAVYNVKTAGSCTTPAVYLATSPDGVAWRTFPSPLIQRGATDALRDIVYRTTFDYDAASGRIRFWYSGAKYDRGAYVWRTVFQERDRDEVFETIGTPATKARAMPESGGPPLLEGP
jgi:hypothetical protein